MKQSLIIVLMFLACHSFGQRFSISGKVMDKANKNLLPGAHISLLHPWGEVFKTTITEANGRFEIAGLSQGGYAIKISFIGYSGFKKEVTITTANVDLGVVAITKGVDLDEVEVTGKIPLAEQKGDTTQFNADAFKTLPDASAEELVEKMPGIVIDNGKVQAQGEDVKEVLVDGRTFFGNDPMAALRNLPAEVVSKIQVFDQRSDQANFSGFDDGETSKTINIITRPNMRNGQFGKVNAGYGSDDRYQIGGNASLFNGNQRISIIAQSNNINQQNFSTEDLLGVVGGGGRRMGRRGGFRMGGGSRSGGGRGRGGFGGGSSVNDFLIQQQGGITTTHALGINYSDKWGKKLDVSGSYFFNMSDNDAEEISSTEFFNSEVVSEIYEERNTSNADNFNHRLNFRITYEIDSSNSIILRPRLSFQQNEGISNTFGQTLLGATLLSQTDNVYRSDLSGMDFSNTLVFRHRFSKPRRTFSIDFRQAYNNKEGESNLGSQDVFFDGLPNPDTIDQFSNLDIKGWTLSTSVNYTEPLGKNSMLMLNYRASRRDDDSDKRTFDFSESSQDYTDANLELSNVFENQYHIQQIGGGYNYSKRRNFIFMARANLQWSKLVSDETFPMESQISRTYIDILPMAMVRMNFSRQENLRIFYMGRTRTPSVEQLQNVIDNSNPLQLSIGNATLDRSYEHRLFARYSKTNTEKASIFYLLISGSFSNNYISNSTYLRETDNPIFETLNLESGTQITLPVNLSGYWTGRLYTTYGFPLRKLKTNLNLDFTSSYTRTPGLINDQLNHSNNKTIGLGVTFSSNISDKVDFTVSTRSTYNDVDNSLQAQLNANYLNQISRVKLNCILPAGIVFRTNIAHQYYSGLTDEFDDSYFLWTAGIGKKVFKNQRGEISLSVFDLLKQNQSISRNVSETYIEDLRSIVLQRYLLLSFTYNFRNFSTGKQRTQQERRERRPFWMRN